MALVLSANKLVVGEKQVLADLSSIKINVKDSSIEISWIDLQNKQQQNISISTNDLSALDLEYHSFSQDCSLVIEFRTKCFTKVKDQNISFYFVVVYFSSKDIGTVEELILQTGKRSLAKKKLPRFLCNRPFNAFYIPTVREAVQACLDIIFITTTISLILQMCSHLPFLDLIEHEWDTLFHLVRDPLLQYISYYYSIHPILTVVVGTGLFAVGWPLLPLVAIMFLIQYSFLIFTVLSAYRYAMSLYRNAKTYFALVTAGFSFIQAVLFKKKTE